MNNYPSTVAKALLDAQAFKISLDPLYTWTSGIHSPVYCDLRALIADVSGRESIVDAFVTLFPEIADADVIAGTATAGIPWAAWVADRVKKPMIYVRSSAKEHGTQKRIEGSLQPGSKVALIEDHISTGKSSVSAVMALREEGQAMVDTIYAINTYQLSKADEAFAAAQVTMKTITNYSVILDTARKAGLIDEEKVHMLADFRKDPATWAHSHNLI